MKRIIFFIVIIFFSLNLNALPSGVLDVTQFLDIPVDGTKKEMVKKLKAKGFKESSYSKYSKDIVVLDGKFNGRNVHVYIGTNGVATTGDKVWRIMVCDEDCVDGQAIKSRFNKLCKQFENNPKYISVGDYTIPEDENISKEIRDNKKRYEAIYYQKPDTVYGDILLDSVARSKYTQDELDNPTEEIKEDLSSDKFMYYFNKQFNKPVWFTISEFDGKYYITMYYDNEYNRADGEDL